MRDKLELARREGMSYALRIAKEKGVDELEEDLKLRNAVDLPISVSKKAFDDCVTNLKDSVLHYLLALGAATLHDEFGFGEKRLNRYIERINIKADCVNGGYVQLQEYTKELQEKYGISFSD